MTQDRPRVLVLDNYDSFTYNLVDYLSEHADVTVRLNTVGLDELRALEPDAIVVSPGPGHPANERDVGVTLDVLNELSPGVPTLGVCLGLEAAVYAYGGTVDRAPAPVHGKASPIDHDGRGVFAGLEPGFRAGRYHSLVATEVPACFEVSATTPADDESDGDEAASERPGDGGPDGWAGGESDDDVAAPDAPLVMGVRHREHPIECVQFHPESVLTANGRALVRNFVSWATADGARPTAGG